MSNDDHQPKARAHTNEYVDFGHQDVKASEKTDLVQAVFSRVAESYDLMNDLMSFGQHRRWKQYLVNLMATDPDATLVDVAGGTGDVAMGYIKTLAQRFGKRPYDLKGKVRVIDRNLDMLRVGQSREADRGVPNTIQWTQGDAVALPIADETMDLYSISFGLRNVTDRLAALSEAARVLKPNGRFFCMEFTPLRQPLLKPIYSLYVHRFIPKVGSIVARDKPAYQYLAESIDRFPDAPTLAEMMRHVGLRDVTYETMMGGVVALHIGRKPANF